MRPWYLTNQGMIAMIASGDWYIAETDTPIFYEAVVAHNNVIWGEFE